MISAGKGWKAEVGLVQVHIVVAHRSRPVIERKMALQLRLTAGPVVQLACKQRVCIYKYLQIQKCKSDFMKIAQNVHSPLLLGESSLAI